jgi:hypothetical protein
MIESINLIDAAAIVQGKDYRQTLLIPGDYTLWTPSAKGRDNLKEDGGNEILVFSFLPLTFPVLNSQNVQCTQLTLAVSNATTSLLKYTKYQGSKTDLEIGKSKVKVNGVNREIDNIYLWDLELESPDSIIEGSCAGWLQVKPEVT